MVLHRRSLPSLRWSAPIAAVARGDADMDRSEPRTFVTDSALTAKINTKRAATRVSRIHVDTDSNGVVWMHGAEHGRLTPRLRAPRQRCGFEHSVRYICGWRSRENRASLVIVGFLCLL